MTEMLMAFLGALWLGILTSISPCPLATNIAAISFLSKKITHPVLVFLSSLAYVFGRMVLYAIVGWVIVNSLLSVPEVAQFLQKYMVRFLGPLLISTGLILLGFINIHLPGFSLSQKHHNKLAESGALGSFLLGFIFAITFCPVSAALFFGSLIPLAISHNSAILLPFAYGMGSGVMVLIFTVAVSLGVKSLSKWFEKIMRLEYYTRKITGIVFVVVGIYYIAVYIF